MLCTLLAFCSEVVGLVAQIALAWTAGDAEPSAWMLLPNVTRATGLVAGTIALLLIPLVYRLRTTPPPAAISVAAVLIGLAPLASLALQLLRG